MVIQLDDSKKSDDFEARFGARSIRYTEGMSEHDGFLQAVREAPDDDAPRLIYADWLDDHGEHARAEFIRAQCALARLGEGDEEYWPLRVRAGRLQAEHGKRWAKPLRHLVRRWTFRRGFVEDVTLSADAFLRHGDELFRAAPVRNVRLLHAGGRVGALARCPNLARLHGLDLRHTEGLDAASVAPLLASRHLAGLRSLGLRGTGLCSGPGLRALAACPNLANLTALDLSEHRRDVARGRRSVLRTSGFEAFEHWSERSPDGALDAGAMRSLVESPYLTRLQSLALAGYGTAFAEGALDVLLSSRVLAGLTGLDLSMDWPSPDMASGVALLQSLARVPQATRLRALRLRKVHSFGAASELAAAPCLAGLTTLELEDAYLRAEWLAALVGGTLPSLTTLRLRGTMFSRWNCREGPAILLGATGLPRLTTLDLHQTTVGPAGVRALLAGPLLRQLRWLSLGNRSGLGSAPVGSEAVQALAASPDAGRLVHLDLGNNDVDDTAAIALGSSPHLRGLISLNLWHNDVGPWGASALEALPSLAFLDLRSNRLPRATTDDLRRRFGPGVRYGLGRRLTDDLSPHSPPPGAPPPPAGADDEIPF
jgi:uncharacterized protein (TIGR02996 family)